jgi:hypothetical protein
MSRTLEVSSSVPLVAALLLAGACGRPASNPMPGGQPDPTSGGSPAPDAGNAANPPAPASQPTLIDASDVKGVWAASSDGKTILVTHTPVVAPSYLGDLTVEHGGKATVLATEGVQWAQYFSADGSAFLFSVANTVRLVRADGTVVPDLALQQGSFRMVGRWLYYQESSSGHWRTWRRLMPDEQPQLIATGSITYEVSKDGEAFSTCRYPAPDCQLFLPDSAGPFAVPDVGNHPTFSPDNKWAVVGCLLFDSSGASRNLGCNSQSPFPSFSQDGRRLVVTFGGAAHVTTLATGKEIVLPVAPQPLVWAMLTPNGERVVASSSDRDLFVADVSGGDWKVLTTDPYWVRGAPDVPIGIAISPDSRIIAANSRSAGVVEAVGGEAVRVVRKNGNPMLSATPVFEPAGGHGRAIFYERNTEPGYHLVIGNADGSGDWVEIPNWPGFARWTGHSVLSSTASATVPRAYDLFVTPANGQQTPFLTGVVSSFVTDSVHQPVLLYVPASGGLYSIPVPQPGP